MQRSLAASLALMALTMLGAQARADDADWLKCGLKDVKVSAPACDRFAANETIAREDRAKALFNKAVTQKDAKQIKAAVASLDASITLSPTAEAFFLRALISGDRKKYDAAEADFLKALELDPENANIMVSRAVFMANAKKSKEALGVLNAAYEIDPENVAVLNNRANLREKLGDGKGAKADFAAAAVRNEQLAQVYRNKGRAVIVQAPPRFIIIASADSAPETTRKTEAKPAVVLPADTRVALVIGNSAYDAVAALRNPANDARQVAEALKALGFKSVDLVLDADRRKMIGALQDFQTKADAADWALVYYAGHGIEVDGVNFLLPTDAQLLSDRNIEDDGVSLDRVLAALDRARKLKLVVLDACRNNPFEKRMERSARTRSVARGLARVEPKAGTLVLYAAKDGEVADDGDGANSPFASAMVKRMREPGIEINKMFRLVTSDVLEVTGNAQQPFSYGSTPGKEDYYFSTLE